MKVTFYLDVCSLWCLYAERSFARLAREYGERISTDWRLALTDGDEAAGFTAAEMAWYYERGAAITGEPLTAGWFDGPQSFKAAPNDAVEAARTLGVTDGRARVAVMEAGLIDGKPICRPEVAIEAVVATTKLDPAELVAAMNDSEVRKRVRGGSRELRELGGIARPAFLFENAIPDRAVLSGIYAYEPLAALAEAMLHDEDRFSRFNATHPAPKSIVERDERALRR